MTNFLIYFILYVVCALSAIYAAKAIKRKERKRKYVFLIILITVFSLIVGLRWDVGKDYMAYYNLVIGNVWGINRIEPFCRLPMLLIQKYELPFYLWFIIMAVIQIGFLVFTFERKILALLPLGVVCFLSYELGFDLNVVRQGCALSIALYAYTFINENKWKYFLIWIIVAAMFHKTAIVFAPLYFIGKYKNILNIKYQLLLFFSFMVLGPIVVQWFIEATGSYWELLSYDQKIDQLADHRWEIKEGAGLGVIFTNLRRFFIILMSKLMLRHYKDSGFCVLYNLFFVGACMYSATSNDMLLERLCKYFSICDIVISAYFFHYTLKIDKRYNLLGYAFLSGVLAITVFEAITSKEWNFVNLL